MALPCNDTRDAVGVVFVAVRARTVRARVAGVRDTTLRVVVRVFVVARPVVVRDVTLRAVPRDTVFAVARAGATFGAVRATVRFATLLRGLARLGVRDVALPARGDCGAAADVTSIIGATGSANTDRIDSTVEQTKNAPASKNIVPIAFLIEFAMFLVFIKLSLCSGEMPRNPTFLWFDTMRVACLFLIIISIFLFPVNNN